MGIFRHLTIRFDWDSEDYNLILNQLFMHLDASKIEASYQTF